MDQDRTDPRYSIVGQFRFPAVARCRRDARSHRRRCADGCASEARSAHGLASASCTNNQRSGALQHRRDADPRIRLEPPFFEAVWQVGPLPHRWNDQAAIHRVLGYDGLLGLGEDRDDEQNRRHVGRIGDAWNSIPGVCFADDPIILHYAGIPDLDHRARLMRDGTGENARKPHQRAFLKAWERRGDAGVTVPLGKLSFCH